ncbi:hypothetical protein BC628DRAFT_1313784 [Trametes gibbosa]|nr:hypothetical protein BC628DRAFT_1313784 [Trametes gibbosa]
MEIVATLSPGAQLKLNDFNLSGWPRDNPLPDAPAKLRQLTLNNLILNYEPPAEPFDLLCLFDLDELVMEGTYINKDLYSFIGPPAQASTMQPIVRSVRVTCMDHLAVSTVMNGGFDQGHLRTLRLCPKFYSSFNLAEAMLRGHHDCLRGVELVTTWVAGRMRDWGPGDIGLITALSSCVHLRTLTLSWSHFSDPYQMLLASEQNGSAEDADNCVLFRLILAATPRTLRKLIFSLPRVRTQDALNHILCHLLPRIKQAIEVLPELQIIRLSFERDFSGAAATEIIRRILPPNILAGTMLQVADS